jgi:xanthine dehydrogenase YagS FAD-binding subunit
MQAFTLVQPQTLSAAIAAGAVGRTAFIAGGTDLMQLMKDDVEAPERLVDLASVLSDRIEAEPEGLRIGAGALMCDVAVHPEVVRRFPVIAEALLASASPQVRNMATIGGNLLQRTRCVYFRDPGVPCNKREPGSGCPAIGGVNRNLAIFGGSPHCIATHASDLAVALVALDAVVELQGADETRRVALTEFHREPGDTPHVDTVLRPGEVIVAVNVPDTPWAVRSYYLKVRDRAEFAFALVSAAVALDVADGAVRDVRIAMGGVGTKPWRALAAESALRGRPATDESFNAAAAAAVQGAEPASRNAFKVTLAQRAVVRALRSVA